MAKPPFKDEHTVFFPDPRRDDPTNMHGIETRFRERHPSGYEIDMVSTFGATLSYIQLSTVEEYSD